MLMDRWMCVLVSVIEGLDKKKVIMAKARHEDPSIRENALLAL